MAGEQPGLNRASWGGVAGNHENPEQAGFPVGPATTGQFNTIRSPLVPIACWRVDDIRFDFDSSFVRSEVQYELDALQSLFDKHPGCPIAVFGHADPVGSDDYNKSLSGRRATTVYAVLIANSNLAKATSLWQSVAAQENWSSQAYAAMQAVTGQPAGTANSAVIQAYLQTIGAKLKITTTDFLGQGSDATGKADYQGCSEFNPLLIFSDAEAARYAQSSDNTQRNLANAPNRRVMVLMFRKGTVVDPTQWPCPRATEGKAGCLKRFWSDGDSRRSQTLPDQRRTFDATHDTFACRFYQRLCCSSPCEQTKAIFRFGYDDRLSNKSPADMQLLVEKSDGTVAKTFEMQDGVLQGSHRIFTYADAVTGETYKAYLTYKKRKLLLIDEAQIAEIMDPTSSTRSVTHVHAKNAPAESDESTNG